jgi:hypothetical protein
MKKVVLIILFSAALLSCGDDDTTQVTSAFSARANGMQWNGDSEIDIYNDSLNILGIISEPEGTMMLRLKFNGEGEYALGAHQSAYSATVGGDVSVSHYEPFGGLGTLKITKYNPETKHVEGSFELALKKVYANPDTSANTLVFTDGHFSGIIGN